ncbi:MAG: peptidyl-prolyl cis-trans isomerase C [Paracoccaceae bacterium]|jgi:peptidyl-prolyl cis-trans isomerase C
MMKFSSLAVVCAATMVFAMPAGAQNADKKADKMATQPAAAADPVVATVNGVNILGSDVEAARGQLPEQYRNLPMDQLYQPILNQLIRTKILSAQARADKLHETDAYKRRVDLLAERMLEEALLAKTVGEKVTDEALQARYDKTSGSFPTKEEIRARHILVKTEAEADAIIKDLTGGADFAKLAAENSIGPSKTRGGDLDYFSKGQMVPPFEEAAFALSKGEFTKSAVKSPFGWHVIKLEDKRQSKPPSFEESRAKLSQELSQEIALQLVKELTEKAKIERFEADGSAPRMKRIQPAPPAR